MDLGSAVSIMRGAIFQIMILSAPILLVSMVVGLVISIFQATTSIQEQTLSFVPKMAAILLVLVFLGPWMLSTLASYTVALFEMIPAIAQGGGGMGGAN
jgi:flagellar biosynthetic protein FliQ